MPNYYFVQTAFNGFDPPYTFTAPNFSWQGGWDWVIAGDVFDGDPLSGAWGGLLTTKNAGGLIGHQTGGATQADPPPATFPDRTVGLLRLATNPLPAQLISGLTDLRLATFNWYGDTILGSRLDGPGGPYLYTRVFLWISVGETDVVRTVLLDYAENVGSGSPWPAKDDADGPAAVIGLVAPQTISGEVFDGDRILLEFGNVLRGTLVDQGDLGEVYLGTYDSDGSASDPQLYNIAPDAVLGETGYENIHAYPTFKVDNRSGYMTIPVVDGDGGGGEDPNVSGCPVAILP